MSDISARFVGVELYFDDLERAKDFYLDRLGLHLAEEQPGHHAKFDADVGANRLVHAESQWPLHDPEGHNILLLQAGAK